MEDQDKHAKDVLLNGYIAGRAAEAGIHDHQEAGKA
jgi:hypothetical protein